MKVSWLGGCLVASLFVLSACGANLTGVRRFAKSSAATADYRELVADYASSPVRQKRYQGERQAERLDELAKARAEQKPQLEAAQGVLAQYMSALGDLAADELPEVDAEVDALSRALKSAEVVGDDAPVDAKTATAASAIAKVLVRASFDGWRQKKVQQLVPEVDPHLQAVVRGLREILDRDFRTSLDAEALAVEKPFQAWIAAATSAGDPDGAPPVARILLEERLERIAQQRAKLDAYLRVLDAIAKGHHDLATHIDALDDDQLVERLKGHARDLSTLHRALRGG